MCYSIEPLQYYLKRISSANLRYCARGSKYVPPGRLENDPRNSGTATEIQLLGRKEILSMCVRAVISGHFAYVTLGH